MGTCSGAGTLQVHMYHWWNQLACSIDWKHLPVPGRHGYALLEVPGRAASANTGFDSDPWWP